PKQQTLGNTQPQQRIRAGVFLAANTAFGAGPTAIAFDTKAFDTAGIWNSAVNPSRLTVPSTGKITGTWKVGGQVYWVASNTGTQRTLQLKKNGSTLLKTSIVAPSAADLTQALEFLINDPLPGDYFELYVSQDSGANRTIG